MDDPITTGAALQLALEGSVVSARAGQRALLNRLIARYSDIPIDENGKYTGNAIWEDFEIVEDLKRELEKL